jgi:hypothetical protein
VSRAVDELDTTMVLHDAHPVPCGVALRRVMRAEGWWNVEVEAASGEYRITDKGSGSEVTLPIVPLGLDRCDRQVHT